ncbi:hypothetical protein IKE80_01095 [Candidatus Saccharibacteria bacterium]|nr:hypothetical protein [Candidatus Saccharibacteria bacterium]
MPVHLSNASTPEYPVEDIKAYYKALLLLVKLPKYWSKYSARLERFFDTGHPVVSNPPAEFEEFCEVYQRVRQAAAKLDLEQNFSRRMLRALARYLYYGYKRRGFYIEYIEDCIEHASTIRELSSVTEIEERYQHHLFCHEKHYKDRGVDPEFRAWKEEGGCPITFYSIMFQDELS